jgi:alpha-methylacyl-CoA racemase
VSDHPGPLGGLKILEFAGIGPVPFCGKLLSDAGADILRIDRPQGRDYDRFSVDTRGRCAIRLDLKHPDTTEVALKLIARADALIEGFRPGVMERLGLGPDQAMTRNPKLIYGRMTGWGQTGPLANAPGHDLNYVALSGALHALGPRARPAVPLNLLGDFGGGALYLAFGIMAALRHVEHGGEGQVIDCAMSEGVASMMNLIYGEYAAGRWLDERESNIIDGGSHFYNTYQCADGQWIAIASIEQPFYSALLATLGLDDDDFRDQMNRDKWPELKRRLAAIFETRTRDDWCALFEDTEVCFAPVLSLAEAPNHPHNQAREAFIKIDGVVQPAPLPRFSKTPAAVRHGPSPSASDLVASLKNWGLDPDQLPFPDDLQ